METLLLNIVKEANGQKLATIRKAAQDAHDLLCSQSAINRTPSHELRTVCFLPLRLSLESKRSKLVSHALTGLHKIVRDERFQAGTEPEDDSLWLPAQLLYATASMLTHSEDTQVHILRVLLSLACGTCWALNGRLVMLVLGRCGEACEIGTQPVRAAAQAAASQTVRAFTTFLDEECQDILQQQQKQKGTNPTPDGLLKTSAVVCFNEAIPVMQYICSRLEESKASNEAFSQRTKSSSRCLKSNETTIFLLECLLTLISTLPQIVHTNTHFTTFLWQRFCPALISLLGTPSEPSAHCLTSQQAKTVYSIGIQLVRLVGCVDSLRPVLEALFHRMVLLPIASKRLEPLRSIRELLRSPERIVDLLLLPESKDKPSNSDDMAIIRLIMDSIEESASCNDTGVMLASVECVVALLTSLEMLCRGERITSDNAIIINLRYTSLEQADYKGPLTYQSLARLPKPYRDVVANLKYASDSDSSGIDGGPGDQNEDGTESDDSGATEGPEEELDNHSDDSIMDDESFLTSHELTKIQSLPKSLHFGRAGVEECNVDVERHNAKHFVKTVQNILLPNLLTLRSSIQVDEVLQEFASKCCEYNCAQSNSATFSTIMNADAIYLATYSALLLNYKLIQLGYYKPEKKPSVQIPLTEDEFVDEVHGSGVLVYLSATWISELYQNVLALSLLEEAGYDQNNGQQYALINLLTDVGDLNQCKFLTDWQKLERVQVPTNLETSPETEAGIKLSRRVLTCCWDSMVTVLSGALADVPISTLETLGGKASKLGLLIPRRARKIQGKKKTRDNLIASSLDGLHKASSLSNILRLQARSSSILALLSSSACQSSAHKLHAAHALSLDVLLSKGLALGSYSSDCWPHVFAACIHVARLEHALFSKAGNAQMLMVAQNANTVITSTTERLNMSFNITNQDEETCVDVYSFLQSPTYSYNNQKSFMEFMDTSVSTIVNKSGAHNTSHGILSNVDAAKVCCVLSQEVDTLFHEAALKLNLPVLCEFLDKLCMASQRQLFSHKEESPNHKSKWWRRSSYSHDLSNSRNSQVEASLLLHRIGDVTLKCIRAGRPLIHTMHVWSIVGPHLMEAACHKDRAVSKKAIQCIHDAVTAILNEQLELPHFHFNEALFKPFENLLCLELCDVDVQDQIVSCLCEFVEANQTEIRSGWRPLFGTLRVANAHSNAAAIIEVFHVFLSTDNTLVFANAALDYILCLLTHIRGANIAVVDSIPTTPKVVEDKETPGRKTDIFQFLQNYDKSTGFFDILETKVTGTENVKPGNIDLCLESLKYLENCVSILAAMYNMPQCPSFNMAQRIKIDTQPQLVDSVIQDIDVIFFNSLQHNVDDELSYKILGTMKDLEECTQQKLTLSDMDKPSGVLKIWYILLEGLASATIVCAKKNQPPVLETLFKLLRDLIRCPGIHFGFYCINHLLLPMVQNWLRQNAQIQKSWDIIASNFKQCCGMASELVVEYLFQLQSEDGKESPAANLALKQLLLILIECVIQPNETIARLGTSCMRHVILSSGNIFTEHQWKIVVTSLHRACAISLNPLQQLSSAFKVESNSFYGDIAVVKVAARRDCTINDNIRLNQLCQQVFLLPIQRDSNPCINCLIKNKTCSCKKEDSPQVIIDDRSYVFLLYPMDIPTTNNPELYTVRVPFRNLIVGILAHQMLIQTICNVLLQTLTNTTPITLLLQANNYNVCGSLKNFKVTHFKILLKCLEVSNKRAQEFDLRPGLKFLTQKVGNLDKAANLYTQSSTSIVVQFIIYIELCLEQSEFADLEDKLRIIWDNLCDSYLNITIQIPEEILEEVEKQAIAVNEQDAPFKFADFKTINEKMIEGGVSEIKEEEKVDEDVKEDGVTETERQVEVMMEHYRNRKSYHVTSPRVNPFTNPVEVPQPQPVPPEIQQQRTLSIRKDYEYYKSTKLETLTACLELLKNLPATRLKLLNEILEPGLKRLATSSSETIKDNSKYLLEVIGNEDIPESRGE